MTLDLKFMSQVLYTLSFNSEMGFVEEIFKKLIHVDLALEWVRIQFLPFPRFS